MKSKIVYGGVAVAVFAIEVAIALFTHDAIIRPYVGDSLAVVLVYLVVRAVTRLRLVPALAIALVVATAVELAQLWNLLDVSGLRHNRMASAVLGGAFDPKDFAAYAAGAVGVAAVELARKPRRV